MSKSFHISTKQTNVLSEGVVRVTKTDELESKAKTAAAKRASSIKRKAVPLDFSNQMAYSCSRLIMAKAWDHNIAIRGIS